MQGHGDVKYHLGYSTEHESRTGRVINLNMHFNPSHLEFVNPVVLGSVRARRTWIRIRTVNTVCRCSFTAMRHSWVRESCQRR